MDKGLIGHKEEYDKLVNSGQLVTDPSTFDFDEELSKKKEEPKYYELFTYRGFIVKISIQNADKYLIVKDDFKKKIRCDESGVHTIGRYIVFSGWDSVVYFNTKKQKVKTKPIR